MSTLAPPAVPLSPAEEESDVEVNRVDQSRINEFGRLNSRKHEIRDEIAECKKQNQELDDAEEGAMMADESTSGSIKILIGDCFVDVDSSYALEYISKQKEKNTTTIDTLDEELRSIDLRQAELKKLLYAKFGRAINLEDR